MPARADITLKRATGLTPEQARDVRARAWIYVFQCWQEKQKAAEHAPEPGGRDDVKESKNGYAAKENHTR